MWFYIKIFYIGHALLFIIIFSQKQFLILIKQHKRNLYSRKERSTSPQKLPQSILCVQLLSRFKKCSSPHPQLWFYWHIFLPHAHSAPATLAFLLFFKESKLIWPQGLCTNSSHCLGPYPRSWLFVLSLSQLNSPLLRERPPSLSQSIPSHHFTLSLALTTIWIDLVLFICFLFSVFRIRPEAPYKQASLKKNTIYLFVATVGLNWSTKILSSCCT